MTATSTARRPSSPRSRQPRPPRKRHPANRAGHVEQPIEMGRLLRFAVGAISFLAAGIHVSAMSPHLRAHVLHGAAFAVMAAFQAVWAYAILRSGGARVLASGVLGHAAIVVLWSWTRSIGLPAWVPGSEGVEPVEIKDAVATLFALAVIAGSCILWRRRLSRRLVGPSAAGAYVCTGAAALALLFVPAAVRSSSAHDHSHSRGNASRTKSSVRPPSVEREVQDRPDADDRGPGGQPHEHTHGDHRVGGSDG